jgi:hypothetical protein
MPAFASTPLLDYFRSGEVPQDIRLLAAQGALTSGPAEQLTLLLALEDDRDPAVAAAARETFAAIPRASLERFLAHPDCPPELVAACAARGVQPAAAPPASVDEPLIDTGSAGAPVDEEERPVAVTSLPVTERVKLALRGTREQRAQLVRDPNRLVAAAVLSSPKLTDTEVEQFAKMGNISEEVLRIIGNNRAWARNYQVMAALCRNPKTPLSVSLRFVSLLNARDVKMLATDRNLPEQVRLNARKFLAKYGKG